jgi:hypothetical protein
MGKEHENGNGQDQPPIQLGAFSDRAEKQLSSGIGAVVGVFGTLLVIVIPVVQTWLNNAKEISLAQIQYSKEQVEIFKSRMQDSDKERDLYKSEMLVCQKDLRQCKAECKP